MDEKTLRGSILKEKTCYGSINTLFIRNEEVAYVSYKRIMASQLAQTAWQSRRARALRPFHLPKDIKDGEFYAPKNLTGMFEPENMKKVQCEMKKYIHGVSIMPMERADKPEQVLGKDVDPGKDHKILADYYNDDQVLFEYSVGHDLVAGFPRGRLDLITCVGCASCTTGHALKIHEFLSSFDFGECGLRPPGSQRAPGGLTIQLEMATFGLCPKLDIVNAVLEASADRQNNRILASQFGGLQIRGFDIFGEGHRLSKKAYQEVVRRTGERSPNGHPQICISWKERPLNQFIWQGGLLVDPGCTHKELSNDEVYLVAKRFSRKSDLIDSQFPTVAVAEAFFKPGWPASDFGAAILVPPVSPDQPSTSSPATQPLPGGGKNGGGKKNGKGKKKGGNKW